MNTKLHRTEGCDMTFEEWWGGERDRALAYDLMKVLTEAAKQAWHAGHVTSIEEMLEKWNRTGVDIDAALHGRVNKESPIANRLRMIAAAQPRWQPIETLPLVEEVPVWLYENGCIILGCRSRDDEDGWLWSRVYDAPSWSSIRKTWRVSDAGIEDMKPSFWMPLPEPPND